MMEKKQRWEILLIWWSPCYIKLYNYFTRDSLTSVFLIFPTRLWSIYRQSMIEHLGPQLSRTQKFKLQALMILFSHWKMNTHIHMHWRISSSNIYLFFLEYKGIKWNGINIRQKHICNKNNSWSILEKSMLFIG